MYKCKAFLGIGEIEMLVADIRDILAGTFLSSKVTRTNTFNE